MGTWSQVQEVASGDSDIDIFTNLTGVSSVEVNAYQRFSQVCVQKSVREGFGLAVALSIVVFWAVEVEKWLAWRRSSREETRTAALVGR